MGDEESHDYRAVILYSSVLPESKAKSLSSHQGLCDAMQDRASWLHQSALGVLRCVRPSMWIYVRA